MKRNHKDLQKQRAYSFSQWFSVNPELLKCPKGIFLQSDTKKFTYEQVGKIMLALSKKLNDWLINLQQDFSPLLTEGLALTKIQAQSSLRIGLLMPSEGNAGIDYVTLILAMFLLKAKFPHLLIIPLNHHKPNMVLKQEINQAGISLIINGFVDRKFLSQSKFDDPDEQIYQVIDFHKLKKYSHSIKTTVLKKWDEELIEYQMNQRRANTEFITPAVALFTSGSSGVPKLAVFTWEQFIIAAASANQFFPFDGEKPHAWLVLLPFYHVSGFSLIARALQGVHKYGGGKLVFTNGNNAKKWWKVVKQHRISHVSLVTAQLPPMNMLPIVKKHLSSLEFVLVGGGPIDPQVLAGMNQKVGKVSPPLFRATYGLTESLAQVATCDGVEQKYPYRILPGRKVKVLCGQIYIHKDTLFSGYVCFPVSVEQKNYQLRYPWTKAGWFPTGDLGKRQGDRIMIFGRKDRQFISGGENIYPEEIERLIQSFIVKGNHAKKGSTLAQISATWTCVIPEVHKKWGQVPVAILKLPSLSETKLKLVVKTLHLFLGSQLESYKVPRKYFSLRYFSLSNTLKKQFGEIKLSPSKVQQEYQKNPKAFKKIFQYYYRS